MFDNIDLEEIVGKNIKEKSTKELLGNQNNIYIKCIITEKEALNGCNKKIRYKYIKYDENSNTEIKRYNEITVKIPPKIKNGNRIIIRNSGNITKENSEEGNLIVEIIIK